MNEQETRAMIETERLKADEKTDDKTLVALVSNGDTFDVRFDEELLCMLSHDEATRVLKLLRRYSKKYLKMDSARDKYQAALDAWEDVKIPDTF